MLRVFVVEDEYLIRKGIIKYIQQADQQFQVVGEAEDGELAYPKILNLKPDLVITDIKMPFMDGLELSRAVKEKLPDIKIIIISAYGEFEYANQAIQIGVDEYLLKPVMPDALLEALQKIQLEIQEERKKKHLLEQLENEKRKKKWNAKQKLFEELIAGDTSIEKLYNRAKDVEINLAASWYNIILIGPWQKNGIYPSRERCREFEQGIKERLEKQKPVIYFERGSEGIALLLKADTYQMLEESIQFIMQAFLKEEDSEFFMAVGLAVERLRELPKCYQQVNRAYSQRYFDTKSSICYAENLEIPEQSDNGILLDRVDISKLQQDSVEVFLRHGLNSEKEQFTDTYLKSVGTQNLQSLIFRQYIAINIQMEALRFLNELHVCSEEVKNYIADVSRLFSHITSQNKIREYIVDILGKCIEFRDRVPMNKYRSVVEMAKQYIQGHYNGDISLNVVAAYVGVSPNHFSRIFSKETGSTFVEYLTKVRMDRAKEMLRCSNKKIVEICYEVGYQDTHYFGTLFKKIVGCTPKEYRMKGI